MGWKYNPFTEKLDLDTVGNEYYRGALASAPTSPVNGWLYFNTGDNVLYVYVGGWIALLAASLSYLLLETGDKLLLETGDMLVLE